MKKLHVAAVAMLAAATLSLTGLQTAQAASSKIVSVNGSEPQNPLVTTNTNEVGGGLILDNIYAGLVYYDAKGTPIKDMAQSITSKDSKVWDIKIKSGWKFTNGEAVTADSYVKAWQYGALLSNAQLNSYYFDAIQGFSYDVDSPLTGLKVISPTEFTVTLSSAQSDFPLRLGYSGFYPLPNAFYADPKGFGENPIGNGPYKLSGKGTWQHNVGITLVKSSTYKGTRHVANAGLKIVFYATLDAAYADLLSGNLDVMAGIPDSAITTFKSDLGKRAILQGAAIFQSFTIPTRLDHFSGAEGNLRRAAISMAIDRKTIVDKIFNGTRKPANDFTSPVISGWSKSVPGSDVLNYNPTKAKADWAAANKISPWSGSFQIAYNSDGGHQGWVDAVTNSIKNVLGIDASGAPYATFKALRTDVTKQTIKTAFRTGWQADYPALSNFLEPLYQTDAGANDGQYSNPAVDKLFDQANSAPSLAAANQYFQKAQAILFKDLPAIPMWYGISDGGYGKNLSNVKWGWNSVPILYNIVKK